MASAENVKRPRRVNLWRGVIRLWVALSLVLGLVTLYATLVSTPYYQRATEQNLELVREEPAPAVIDGEPTLEQVQAEIQRRTGAQRLYRVGPNDYAELHAFPREASRADVIEAINRDIDDRLGAARLRSLWVWLAAFTAYLLLSFGGLSLLRWVKRGFSPNVQ